MADSKPTAISHFDSSAHSYEKSTGGCTRELARSILDLPELRDIYSKDAVILDSACGTAIVTEELVLQAQKRSGTLGQIHAADPAPNMVEIARSKIAALGLSEEQFNGKVMPGEKLDYPDNTFTHSITNLGILFYTDAAAGAKEIYRTLKPGGVAVVTSWAYFGYIEEIIRPAQALIRPNDPPYQIPLNPAWTSPQHVEDTMKGGGFEQVKILEVTVHYGAATITDLHGLLGDSFKGVVKEWSEEEQRAWKEVMLQHMEKTAVEYTMNDGKPGRGVQMKAIVAVCQK